MSSEQPTQLWYTQTWVAVVALVLFFPLGLFLMWRFQRWEVWIKTVITVVGSLFAIFIIVGAAIGGEETGGVAIPTVEGSPSPTVEEPTPSPEPTPTPEPTPSPEPTPTPEPSMPEVTAAECQYLGDLVEQLTDVGDAFSNIGELSGRSDLFSDDWILEMALQFVIIQLTEEAALALDPPASLDHIHTEWLSIMDTSVQATELMTEGIDELDASKIDAATGLIKDVGMQTQEATFLLAEFTASRSGQCP